MSILTGINVPRQTLLNDLRAGVEMAVVSVPAGALIPGSAVQVERAGAGNDTA